MLHQGMKTWGHSQGHSHCTGIKLCQVVSFERTFIMKKLLLSCAVLAGAALTATSASAEMLNQWLLDQLNAPAALTQSLVQAPTSVPSQAQAVKVSADMTQTPQAIKTEFQPASVDAGQPATLQSVNSEPAPLK